MSDFLRIILIGACMYLCFRLGFEYAVRKMYSSLMEGFNAAAKQFSEALKEKDESPAPNETLETE